MLVDQRHLTLLSDDLSVTVVPQAGARVVSLRSHTQLGAREWLADSSSADLNRSLTAADGFVRPGMGGWDEVIPTISPTRLPDGSALTDHGEAWRRPWTVVHADEHTIRTRLHLNSLPLVVERTIAAVDGGFRWDYLAYCAADADGPVPVHWTAHPQFAARPGTRLVLRGDPDHALIHFPLNARDSPLSLNQVPAAEPLWSLADGSAIKAFLPPGTVCGGADLVDPDGLRLTMSWDPALTSYLGLWWDRAAFAATPVIGIEPSTGYGDDAALAQTAQQVLILKPGQQHSWWVEVGVRAPEGTVGQPR